MNRQMLTLGSIAAPKGLQTGPFGSQLKAEEYTEIGIPVVMPKDISAGKIVTDDIARVSEEKAKKLAKHMILPGDIIFPRRGDLGRIGVVEAENKGWLCGTGCLRARLRDNVDTNYIHQYVQLEIVKQWLESNSLGQTMRNLNTEIISNLPVYLVPKKEQSAIVDLLSTWDTAIEKAERIVGAKEKQFRWLLIQLLSSRMRVREFSEKWTPYSFNEIFTTHQVINSNNYNYPVLSVTKGGIVNQSEYFNKEIASDDKSNYLIVERGNFVMSGLNFWMGSVDFQNICDIGIVSPAYKVFRVNKADIDPDYIRFYVRSPMMTKILTQASIQGASIVRRNLDMKSLNESQILLPSLKEQEAITEILLSTEKELLLHSQQLTAYKAQKRGLMQKLLTGQWRVKLNDEVTYGE